MILQSMIQFIIFSKHFGLKIAMGRAGKQREHRLRNKLRMKIRLKHQR